MKAFIVDRYGKKARGRIGELPDPKLRENDVLVQVYAAGVNLLDSKIRSGEFKLILPYRLPLILGNDVAGVVVQIGPRVRRFKIGDKVYARPPQDRIGSFAELISMNEDAVAMIPKKLTMEEAASIPLVGLTAWQALIERANLKKGQKVSSMLVPVVSEQLRFNWRSIWVRPWRRQRARQILIWSRAWAQTLRSTIRRPTDPRSVAQM